MNILVITTEFGHKAGGLALACTRLVDILKQKHEVHVIISTEAPIHTASGCINPHIEDRIRKEYKLKEDYWLHRHSDIIIAFGGGWNGYYASLLSGQTESPLILALRGSDINLAKWSAEEVWYFREPILWHSLYQQSDGLYCRATAATIPRILFREFQT